MDVRINSWPIFIHKAELQPLQIQLLVKYSGTEQNKFDWVAFHM